MNIDNKIAGMCLYGFIRGESPSQQRRCIEEIELHYGPEIARIVENYLKEV